MPRISRNSLLKWIPVVWCAALAACWTGERVSGSSTTQENTVQGIAVLADGRPAFGASVRARTGRLENSTGGPSWTEVDGTLADTNGAFTLTVPDDTGFYLEIRERPADSLHPPVYAEIFFSRFEKNIGGGRQLGTLRMTTSGALKGLLVDSTGKAPQGLWLGVEGIPGLVQLVSRPDSTGSPFQLSGLPPGKHTLILVEIGTVGGAPARKDLILAEVKAGVITDLGAIPYDGGSVKSSGGQ